MDAMKSTIHILAASAVFAVGAFVAPAAALVINTSEVVAADEKTVTLEVTGLV